MKLNSDSDLSVLDISFEGIIKDWILHFRDSALCWSFTCFLFGPPFYNLILFYLLVISKLLGCWIEFVDDGILTLHLSHLVRAFVVGILILFNFLVIAS